MPSASTAKLEKQASTEAVDPLRQAIVVIDHKIRNLVKRQRKIEQYEAEQKSGKNLNSDQLSAVSKKDEVMQTLEFARDLSKSFNIIALDTAKVQKKQARKEALERNQQDIAKVKEILLVQDILANMGQDNVREDFLAGQNGAVQLTEEELKYLDDLYGEVSPKRIAEEGSPPFQDQLQHSAEHLVAIVDGKTKEIVGTTYLKLKEIVASIQSCGYFDQATEEAAEGNSEQLEAAEVEEVQEPAVEEEVYVEKESTVVAQETATFLQAIPTVPLEVQPVVSMLVQQQQAVPISTPVATSEGSYFSTAAATFIPGQMQQTQRSIPEFISSVTDGSIHFLQDPSEHQQIPEQTASVPIEVAADDWSKTETEASDWNAAADSQGDWNTATDNQGDWNTENQDWCKPTESNNDWSTASSGQGDGYITQGSRNYGGGRGRSNRGGGSRGGTGYSGGRGRGSYQNDRGNGGGYQNDRSSYNYRERSEGGGGGGNYYQQQNGYQQRDNYGNSNYRGGSGGGYKRGGPREGSGQRGGMDRGGPRGGPGARGGNPRGARGSGGGYTRGNKQ